MRSTNSKFRENTKKVRREELHTFATTIISPGLGHSLYKGLLNPSPSSVFQLQQPPKKDLSPALAPEVKTTRPSSETGPWVFKARELTATLHEPVS